MKATELRIGNLVNIQVNEFNWLTVREIECVGDIKSKNYNIVFDSFKAGIKSVKPILITEEWLVKFGFKPDDVFHHWEDGNIQLSKEENIAFPWNDDEDHTGKLYLSVNGEYQLSKIPIEYVHQLQNLYFALTGKEL